MLLALALKKLIGSKNDRELKRMLPMVQRINHFETTMRKLSDAQLQAKTGEFRSRLDKGESLEQLLFEAFAACREAGARVLGMRHFDVQLIGGIVLHEGRISEMKTGEGKTLVATLPSYLNGLTGKGTHIITVNDYLAKRDSDWMGRLHRFMGLNVGCIQNAMNDRQRKEQYNADVTYGTNNEFGFDYLRDNMKPNLDLYVQKDPNFAIVDEVDSILIDEARTPLIISGPSEDKPELYYVADKAVRALKRDMDFTLDEKHRSTSLTEEGIHKLEGILKTENLYAPENLELVHHVNAALRAHALFKKDTDYVVRDGQVVIVDEFTGRLMPGRRWSDGLHQAIEAKEGVKIEPENQTLATITLQNYFRLYPKLAGMTGTADTEAAEFKKIYRLEVVVIPPNRPMVRNDSQDLVYRNEAGKYRAVTEDIREKHEAGRPVLVGTVSVAKSERVSKLLTRIGIPHNVLNAKNHEREAEIIANAGARGGVTIATNMAGRGTDIILGAGVANLGGLHVIGTERHESRRIDNQLRGRAGRQGDPGSSQFYLSLEDDLMRIFANDRVVAIMDRLGMEEDVPIQDGLVSKSIANAQKKVELHHFDQREHVLKYDDVLNKQREVIYAMRRLVLDGKEVRALVEDLTRDFIGDIASTFANDKVAFQDWDWKGFDEALKQSFAMSVTDELRAKIEAAGSSKLKSLPDAVAEILFASARAVYAEKEKNLGEDMMRDIEKYFLIQSIDQHWREHLLALDHLKEGIHLRGYAQKDPLVEYRKEGFLLFKQLDRIIKQSALSKIFTVRPISREEQERMREQEELRRRDAAAKVKMSGPALAAPDATPTDASGKQDDVNRGVSAALSFMRNYQAERTKALEKTARGAASEATPSEAKPVTRATEKIGRNDPCYCGSGKKYKQCHGRAGADVS